jgi:hypothetical protein
MSTEEGLKIDRKMAFSFLLQKNEQFQEKVQQRWLVLLLFQTMILIQKSAKRDFFQLNNIFSLPAPITREQGCQMVCFIIKTHNFGILLKVIPMVKLLYTYGKLLYFIAFSYILWSFVIFSEFFYRLNQEKSGNPARECEKVSAEKLQQNIEKNL